MSSWSGKSRGNSYGYSFFIFIVKKVGVQVAYRFLRIVTIYYYFFPGKATHVLRYYFGKRLGYNAIKTRKSIYKNFNALGETIIDKIAIMANVPVPFTYESEHISNLHNIVAQGKGGILLSAHIGNWEAAGHLLKDLKTTLNIVMYEGEHQKIKQQLDAVRQRSFHVIEIKNDITHIYEINEALKRNELVCLHADRYVEGNRTIEGILLNATAQFPIGPFLLASTFNVPISFVFGFKDSSTHYHFYSTVGKVYPSGKQSIPLILNDYLTQVENRIKRYPLQWYNYFPFWDDEKK